MHFGIKSVLFGAILLSGCASAGRFVSTGPMNYGLLMESLGCEVKAVFEEGKRENGKLIPIDRWKASVTVVIEGNLDRNASFGTAITGLSVLNGNSLGASLNGNRKFSDVSTVGLEKAWLYSDLEGKCNEPSVNGYDISRIGLKEWYMRLEKSRNIKNYPDYINIFQYERTVEFVHFDGNVSLELFEPVKFTPGLSLKSSDTATITVNFEKLKDPEPSKAQLVKLDQSTLNALSDILRGKAVSKSTGKSKRTQPISSARSQEKANPTAEDQLRRKLEERSLIRLLRESEELD